MAKDNLDIESRFRRRLNYLIGVFTDATGRYPDEGRTEVKEGLQRLGLIKKSTKELDLKGLAKACNMVEQWINELRLPLK